MATVGPATSPLSFMAHGMANNDVPIMVFHTDKLKQVFLFNIPLKF